MIRFFPVATNNAPTTPPDNLCGLCRRQFSLIVRFNGRYKKLTPVTSADHGVICDVCNFWMTRADWNTHEELLELIESRWREVAKAR